MIFLVQLPPKNTELKKKKLNKIKKLKKILSDPLKCHHEKKKKEEKGFTDTKIEISPPNKDQTGQGLDLWSCFSTIHKKIYYNRGISIKPVKH